MSTEQDKRKQALDDLTKMEPIDALPSDEQDKEIDRIAYQLYIELEAATKLNGNLSSDAEGIEIVQDWLRMVLRSYGSKEYERGEQDVSVALSVFWKRTREWQDEWHAAGGDKLTWPDTLKLVEWKIQREYERGRKEMREEILAALPKSVSHPVWDIQRGGIETLQNVRSIIQSLK